MEGPIPAQSLPSATLFDVMASVRRALTRRGEYLAPEWFDRAIQDLHTGVLSGWYLPPQPPDAAAFAFVSERPPRGFGHLHIEAGREAVSRGLQLVRRLVA
ncbi:MAG TPA: hypothetical protein VJS68_00515, partial [Thermoplasmata archaeon]|nr:hypothetical protein [Thermoplasmata archaeon]